MLFKKQLCKITLLEERITMTISAAKRILEKRLLENNGKDKTLAIIYDYYAAAKERTERFIKHVEKSENKGLVNEEDYAIGEVSLQSIIDRINAGATLDSICDDRMLSNEGWSIGEIVRMLKLNKPWPGVCVPGLVQDSLDDYQKYKEENKSRLDNANEKFLGLIKNFGYAGMI